jgi:hypothetical protein
LNVLILASDAGMVTAILDVLMKAVFGDLKRRVRDYGIEQAQCGAVTFVQRFWVGLELQFALPCCRARRGLRADAGR